MVGRTKGRGTVEWDRQIAGWSCTGDCPQLAQAAARCGSVRADGPVVVSDIAAHREFLDETSALLVSPDSVSAVSEAIQSTFSRPEEARERALRARTVAERYSPSAMTESYEQVYRQVLDAPQKLTGNARQPTTGTLDSSASRHA